MFSGRHGDSNPHRDASGFSTLWEPATALCLAGFSGVRIGHVAGPNHERSTIPESL
jgi:hypothetical protein